MLLDNPIPINGGVHLAPNKAQSLETPLRAAELPSLLKIPLRQHIGSSATPVVKVGDHVLKGQGIACHQGFISSPIHASSSGTVIEIADHPIPSPSGHSAPCMVIEIDGKDEWYEHKGIDENLYNLSPAQIHDIIHAAGIVGLGGAGFPSAVKMLPGMHFDIHLLIVNAAECEPYITCDDVLMQKNAKEIIAGLEILRHAVQAHECVIGIEDSKTEAIAALTKALEDSGETSASIVKLPTIYPMGGEKQLIKALTGLEVPTQGLPLDIGIICYNIGTIHAVYKAVTCGEPLISRVVTMTGKAIKEPCNLDVLIGTPLSELVKQCGGYTDDLDRILIGGPMMGFELHDDVSPVIKTTNCMIAATEEELPHPKPALPCIRCGDCAVVCPINLLPQELYWHARAQDYDKLQEYKIFDCIECSCCSYVCPSHIPLVKYFQTAKTEIWNQERHLLKSEHARQRYESRQTRLEHEEQEREKKQKESDEKKNIKAEISAAVEREKARQAERKSQTEKKDD